MDSNASAVLLDNKCGGDITKSESFSTTQRYARVEMTSDGATENAGFSIDVIATKDYCKHCI